MLRQHKLHVLLASVALMASVAASGCSKHSTSLLGSENSRHVTVFTPAKSAFADSLGIVGPITEAQAKDIAVLAAGGGTALSVEREDQDGTQVFGVQVQTTAGVKDVKVRISDGAVTQIEEGGPDTGTEQPGKEN